MSDAGPSVGSGAAGDIYGRLALQHPNRTALGGALITMVEPDPGYERTYNRWYEDDHFYSGAMVGPWAFAGARWVATRRLQLLRYPSRSRIAIPVTAGCYLSAFWVTKGHLDEYEEWSATVMRDVLYPEGRGFDHRTHIHSGFHSLAFSAVAMEPMRVEHALDRRFPGLVLEVLESPGGHGSRPLLEWLRDEHVPAWMGRVGAAACAAFTARPLPSGSMPFARQIEHLDSRLTLMWFLDQQPDVGWQETWAGHDVTLGTRATVELCAPFIPTVPGTDNYVDEIRS
jgi:hypothetical protein